jgi:hypothetical protein
MAIDPKDVPEGECLNCGESVSEHLAVEALAWAKICPTFTTFNPKPPAPKAKPGVRYRRFNPAVGGWQHVVGLQDGSVVPFSSATSKTQFSDGGPDWQEVE